MDPYKPGSLSENLQSYLGAQVSVNFHKGNSCMANPGSSRDRNNGWAYGWWLMGGLLGCMGWLHGGANLRTAVPTGVLEIVAGI